MTGAKNPKKIRLHEAAAFPTVPIKMTRLPANRCAQVLDQIPNQMAFLSRGLSIAGLYIHVHIEIYTICMHMHIGYIFKYI